MLKVKVPASEFILETAANVIEPANAFAPEIFLIAPSLLIPLPEIVIGSASNVFVEADWTCNAAPELTVVPALTLPNAAAAWIFTKPSLILVAPE